MQRESKTLHPGEGAEVNAIRLSLGRGTHVLEGPWWGRDSILPQNGVRRVRWRRDCLQKCNEMGRGHEASAISQGQWRQGSSSDPSAYKATRKDWSQEPGQRQHVKAQSQPKAAEH